MIKTALVTITYAVISGLAAWSLTDVATDYGAFGSCFEGGCGLGALFVGFPIFWLTLFMVLLLSQHWHGSSLFISWLSGRKKYLAVVLGFPSLWAIFLITFFMLLELEETLRREGYI
jgi:hypothetical protein